MRGHSHFKVCNFLNNYEPTTAHHLRGSCRLQNAKISYTIAFFIFNSRHTLWFSSFVDCLIDLQLTTTDHYPTSNFAPNSISSLLACMTQLLVAYTWRNFLSSLRILLRYWIFYKPPPPPQTRISETWMHRIIECARGGNMEYGWDVLPAESIITTWESSIKEWQENKCSSFWGLSYT
jgi:hypothetical protein